MLLEYTIHFHVPSHRHEAQHSEMNALISFYLYFILLQFRLSMATILQRIAYECYYLFCLRMSRPYRNLQKIENAWRLLPGRQAAPLI
jgi:hypothetical protein